MLLVISISPTAGCGHRRHGTQMGVIMHAMCAIWPLTASSTDGTTPQKGKKFRGPATDNASGRQWLAGADAPGRRGRIVGKVDYGYSAETKTDGTTGIRSSTQVE